MKMNLKDTRGAALVEFAIIFPLLLVLLFGIIEFGIYMYNKQMLTNAAREGARAGIVASIPRVPPETIQDVVRNYFDDYAITFGDQNNVSLDPDVFDNYDDEAEFGDPLEVRVTYKFSFLVFQNILKLIGGDWLDQVQDMTATATMRYE